MAKKKEETKMSETNVVVDQNVGTAGTEAVPVYKIQELKQKQSILNLDTMEDDDVVVVTQKIVFNENVSVDEKLATLQELVSPAEKQVSALVKFLETESYRVSKEKALASGNFMSAQLRSALTQIMGGVPAFSENKAVDNFKYWQAAFTDKTDPTRVAKAKKLLDRARLLVETDEFNSM